jgi:pyruvate/2-oxoglutarate dehydrogenase complex dihydrolipoamide acyltransferase (E2) component
MPAVGGSQAALLGVGAAERRLVAVEVPNGTALGVRTRTILTLWYDARHLSQAQADAFLGDIRQRIEHGMDVW